MTARSSLEASVETLVELNEKRPVRVLHVDDESCFLKVAKECLESQGRFEVDTATSVEDAMKKMKNETYDVIISDYQMPEKDGLQFLEELREKGDTIPFIIFTGKGREEIAIRALNLGADQYLNKMGAPETVYGELAYGIRRAAERKRAEVRIRESEERFRRIYENARDCMIFLDKSGRIIDVNRQAVEIFGGSKEELLGKHFTETGVMHVGDVPKLLKAFAESLAEKPMTLPVRIKNKKGQEILLEASASHAIVNNESVTIVIARDITERMKAEEAIRGSEEKYRTLVDNSLQGILIVQDFHIAFANQAAAEISGYTTQELLSLPPERVKAMIHPEDQKLVWGRFFDRLAGKPVDPHYEYRGIRKDGTVCWLEMFATQVDYNGKPAIQGTLIDITERKKAEQAIRESQQKFEALFRHIPEAAVSLDADFRILDVNARFCQLFGYSAEEVKGRHINEVVVPEGMSEEAERLDKDAVKGYVSHYALRKRRDGSLVHVSISAAPVTFENELLGFVGLYKDITELKNAQEELEKSKRHFQMLFNLMADPVSIVDERGKILEVTQKVEETTGFKREELVGKNFLRTEIATAKTKAIMIKNLAKRMLGGHLEPYEVEMLTKDKRKLTYEINASKIEYKGKPADLVVFRDISERKKLEEKLRVVGGLTRHDVRNKLSVVTGNIYLLRRKLAGDRETLERLSDMDSAIRQVERIFEFAKNYERLGVEKLANLDVGKAVDEAVSLFSDLKNVRIVNECKGLTVCADSLLRQMFYNLIDNSLKYGGRIRSIRIYYMKPSDSQLELVYEDDGVGLASNVRSNLFKEGAGKGTGYGLFMIKRICEVYGWTITEKGERNKGVRFIMKVPVGGKPLDVLVSPQTADKIASN